MPVAKPDINIAAQIPSAIAAITTIDLIGFLQIFLQANIAIMFFVFY